MILFDKPFYFLCLTITQNLFHKKIEIKSQNLTHFNYYLIVINAIDSL